MRRLRRSHLSSTMTCSVDRPSIIEVWCPSWQVRQRQSVGDHLDYYFSVRSQGLRVRGELVRPLQLPPLPAAHPVLAPEVVGHMYLKHCDPYIISDTSGVTMVRVTSSRG